MQRFLLSTWGLFLTGVTALALLEASVISLRDHFDGVESNFWTEALPRGALNWYLWALHALLVFAFVRYLLDRRIRGAVHVLIHIPLGFAIVALYMLSNAGITLLWIGYENADIDLAEQARTLLRIFFVDQSISLVSIYIGIVAACYAFQYYRPALRASQLQTRLQKAKLDALIMQLQPHFLFNTLNSVSVLVHKDPTLAERMITRLAELLRMTLSRGKEQQLTLREELDFLDRYCEIEQIRFADRLRFDRAVEPDTLDARVPTMILQPIVENAIKHGIAKRAKASRIDIRAHRDGDRLVLEVEDDGPGITSPDGQVQDGVGIANTRARLKELYGDQQSLEFIPTADGPGLTVQLTLPYIGENREE